MVLILSVIAFLTLIPFMVLVRHWRSDGEVNVDVIGDNMEKSLHTEKDQMNTETVNITRNNDEIIEIKDNPEDNENK